MYPRATVKKIVKAHSKCNVSKNVDVMVSPTCIVNHVSEARLTIIIFIDVFGLRPIHANVRAYLSLTLGDIVSNCRL